MLLLEVITSYNSTTQAAQPSQSSILQKNQQFVFTYKTFKLLEGDAVNV